MTVINSSGNGIAAPLDSSYYKGQGLRQGIEREFVAVTIENRSEFRCFQNTGQGWWNESDTAATLRTPCGGDSVKANLIVETAEGWES